MPVGKKCTAMNSQITAPAAMRAGVLPCFLGLTLIIAAFMALRGGKASVVEVVTTALFILVALFLVFSDEWKLAVLYCTWATLALILCGGGFYGKVTALVLMASLAILIALGPALFLKEWIWNGPTNCYGTSGSANVVQCMISCANYFGAFRTDPEIRPRDADPRLMGLPFPDNNLAFSDFHGLCAENAIYFRYVLYALLPGLSVMATVAMGAGLLQAEAPKKADTPKSFASCASCNARMKPDARFCVMCGTPTVPPANASSEPTSTNDNEPSDTSDPKAVEMRQLNSPKTTDGPETVTERGPDGIWREKVVS